MKRVSNYIVHRHIDMNGLVAMVNQSIAEGYQPYGDLSVLNIRVNSAGILDINGTVATLTFIQAMVKHAE